MVVRVENFLGMVAVASMVDQVEVLATLVLLDSVQRDRETGVALVSQAGVLVAAGLAVQGRIITGMSRTVLAALEFLQL